jgi:hypothetical protein
MRHLTHILFLASLTGLAPVRPLGGQVRALQDSDLVIKGVSYDADTSVLRTRLGIPLKRKSGQWSYAGLTFYLENGRVHQVHITSRRVSTFRGLRVGYPILKSKHLYGDTCYADSYTYCRTLSGDFDARGILVEVRHGRVSKIILGAVFET